MDWTGEQVSDAVEIKEFVQLLLEVLPVAGDGASFEKQIGPTNMP